MISGVGAWARWEEQARRMTLAQLHQARLDCCKAAEAMDSIDREHGGDRAGRYRDEASVYVREIGRR